MLLEGRNITKWFGDTRANYKISVDFEKGKKYALVGENGAGKTTLLNILFGLYKPDKGTIKIKNEEIKNHSPKKSKENGIVMVHQFSSLVPQYSLIENLAIMKDYPGKLLNLSKPEAELRSAKEELEFEIDIEKETRLMSVEDLQKAEILRAFCLDPDLVLLDEPASNLTPLDEESVLSSLTKMVNSKNTSIVMTTHRFYHILDFSDEVIVLRKGEKVLSEKTKQLDLPTISNAVLG